MAAEMLTDGFPIPLPCKVLPASALKEIAQVVRRLQVFSTGRALKQFNSALPTNNQDVNLSGHQISDLEAMLLSAQESNPAIGNKTKVRIQAQLRHFFHLEIILFCESILRVIKFLTDCTVMDSQGYIHPVKPKEVVLECYSKLKEKIIIDFPGKVHYEINSTIITPPLRLLHFLPLLHESLEKAKRDTPTLQNCIKVRITQELLIEQLFYQD